MPRFLMPIAAVCFVAAAGCGADAERLGLPWGKAPDDQETPQPLPPADLPAPPPEEPPLAPSKSPLAWRTFPIVIRIDPSFSKSQVDALQKALVRWEAAVGRQLFEVAPGHHLPQDDYASAGGGDGVNSIYLASTWAGLAEDLGTGVLAFARPWTRGSEIVEADIVFNADQFEMGDSLALKEKALADIESVALHEVGHLLGFPHVDTSEEPFSAMIPEAPAARGWARRRLTSADVSRAHARYGCRLEECSPNIVARSVSGAFAVVKELGSRNTEANKRCKARAESSGLVVGDLPYGPYEEREETPEGILVSYRYACE